MLKQQTVQKLNHMKLHGMATAFEEQLGSVITQGLSYEERFGLVVDHEWTYRENQKMQRLLKSAKFRANACVEDIDFSHKRDLDKSQIASLATSDWIRRGFNLILTGPTGCGKTWIISALGNQACRHGLTVRFVRFSQLLEELELGRADGTLRKKLNILAKVDLLIIDDFGTATLSSQSRQDFLEVIDSRSETRSIALTSQIPVKDWHEYLSGGNPTTADAILDRLDSSALRINLVGESMRKKRKVEF